jgi:ribosomal protein S18 acetylase RimI-like enzyme
MRTLLQLEHHPEFFDSIAGLYHQVWAQGDIHFAERLKRQSQYDGFRGLVLTESEQVLGFCYGYHSLAGQYYHDLLARGLGPVGTQQWLSNCFELVELAIAPQARRQGIGKLLCQSLLINVPYRTAVLTTQTDNYPARNLYISLGWQNLIEPFYPNTVQAFVIMGKILG